MSNSLISNSRVLVTGGAGFIGSNLCENLLEHGNEVVCLDNFATGCLANLSACVEHRAFKLIEGDIRSKEDCQKAVDGVEYVLHHAALGSVPRSIHDPSTTHDVNVTGFLNILQAAQKAKVKRFAYASSSSVYGDHPALPKVEENLGKPLSPYAVSKYANELYAHAFSHLYPEFEIIGLRYFNVFGRRQNPDGAYAAAIPKFVKALIKLESPTIFGDGHQSRDFTYIDNVVAINHLALITKNRSAIHQVYNVACGSRTSLNDLWKIMISNLSQYNEKVAQIMPTYTDSRPGDVTHSHACIDKARRLLNYQPLHHVVTGLPLCLKWYWENLSSR